MKAIQIDMSHPTFVDENAVPKSNTRWINIFDQIPKGKALMLPGNLGANSAAQALKKLHGHKQYLEFEVRWAGGKSYIVHHNGVTDNSK